MANNLRSVLIIVIILILSVNATNALTIELNKNSNGELLNSIKFNGDLVVSSFWIGGLTGNTNIHAGLFDYRTEGTINDVKLGSLTARITGLGFIDERIDSFIDDPLLDIPEIFYRKNFQINTNNGFLVFGKFANRRFFNKDEYSGDPFDIGERRFAGAQVNTLNIFSGINEFRDSDLRDLGSREATGSYGFAFGLKNKHNVDFRQALAVAQIDNFKANFYGISELSKEFNLGSNHPSKIMLGYLYANDEVFRIPDSNHGSSLIYTMYDGRYKKLGYYARYGSLFATTSNEDSFVSNEARLGINYRFTKKDSCTSWIGYLDNPVLTNQNNTILWTNVYRRVINDYMNLAFAFAIRFNDPNPNTKSGQDNDWTLSTHLQFHF